MKPVTFWGAEVSVATGTTTLLPLAGSGIAAELFQAERGFRLPVLVDRDATPACSGR
jgi:hypothetical protein